MHGSSVEKYAIQWVTYVLLGLPFVWLMKKKLRFLYNAGNTQVTVGIGLVVAAGLYNLLTHPSHERFVVSALIYLLVGFVEELIFRGYFFAVTENHSASTAQTIVGTSVLFALWHVPSIWLVSHDWTMIVTTFAFGCLFGLIRHKSKNLLLVSLAHAAVDISS